MAYDLGAGTFGDGGEALAAAHLNDRFGRVGTLTKLASARTGAVSRALLDKAQDFDAAADFGIVPDGTDQSTKVAAAMTAMASGGGRLHLRSGTYRSSVPWAMGSGMWLAGTGDATVLVNLTANTSTIAFAPGSTGCGVSDLKCTSPVAQYNGAGSTVTLAQGCNGVHLRRLTIVGPFVGIRVSSSVVVWIDGCQVYAPTISSGCGILIDQIAGYGPGNDHYITNTLIEGQSITQQPRCAVSIQSSGGTWMDTVGGLWSGFGMILEPGAGQTVEHLFSSRCAWDTGAGHGLLVLPAAGGQVRRCQSVGDWFCTNQQHGIAVAGAGIVDVLRFDAMRAMNNGWHGVLVSNAAAKNLHFAGFIAGNSGAASGTYDGINIAAGVTDFAVDARIGAAAGFAASHRYGVYIAPGASDRYAVRNNLSGNGTGGLSDGGTGTSKRIELFGS